MRYVPKSLAEGDPNSTTAGKAESIFHTIIRMVGLPYNSRRDGKPIRRLHMPQWAALGDLCSGVTWATTLISVGCRVSSQTQVPRSLSHTKAET